MQVRSLGWEDPLEEGMAIHSSSLALRIPWTGEPGGLRPIRSQRVGNDWSALASMLTRLLSISKWWIRIRFNLFYTRTCLTTHAGVFEINQMLDAFELWCWRRLLRIPCTARGSNQSILKEITLNNCWKDWCRSWSSNTLATWCKKPTHWKRPWFWER